jgi:hypothetical protein
MKRSTRYRTKKNQKRKRNNNEDSNKEEQDILGLNVSCAVMRISLLSAVQCRYP